MGVVGFLFALFFILFALGCLICFVELFWADLLIHYLCATHI